MKLSRFIAPATIVTAFLLAAALPTMAKGGPGDAPGQGKKPLVQLGSVKNFTGNSFRLNDDSTATVDATTKVVGQARKVLRLSQVGPGDLVALITETGSNSGKPKRMFVRLASESAQIAKRQAVMGVIVNISGNTLTVAQQIHRDRTWTVITTPQTIIKGSSAGSVLAVGQRISAVGMSTPAGLVARWIHIIPGKATGVFNKQPAPTGTPIGTPSGTPTATPSGTPTATPSATPILTPTVTPKVTVSPTPSPSPTVSPTI